MDFFTVLVFALEFFAVLVFVAGLFVAFFASGLSVRAGRFPGNVPCCHPKTSGNKLTQTTTKPKTKLPIRRLTMGFRRIELSFLDKTAARTWQGACN
ncbi:MAG: hypothetical protein ABGX05_04060 [Pirellulaceae bacterium]